MNRPWTGAEQNRLRTHFAAGLSDDEIGALLGRSGKSVEGRRRTLRLLRIAPFWTIPEHRTIKVMFNAGRTDAEIAQTLGRTRSSVAQRRRDLGMRRQGGSPSMRGVCLGLVNRQSRIAAALASAGEPMNAEDLIPQVYSDGIGPDTAAMSIRVMIHRMRKSGVPIVTIPGRGGYILERRAA